jgi:hypothetical protein
MVSLQIPLADGCIRMGRPPGDKGRQDIEADKTQNTYNLQRHGLPVTIAFGVF